MPKAWDIRAWTYDADIHCCDCAEERFGVQGLAPESDAVDQGGDTPKPVFESDEAPEWGESCGTCGAVLSKPWEPEEEEEEEAPVYRVMFYAYCGMSHMVGGYEYPLGEARELAARIIRKRRKSGHPVWTLNKGTKWEVGEPEDCPMVPDSAGILSIRPA